MRKITIAELAAADERNGGYYFSRATLKFFGQTRKSFSVVAGQFGIFVYAPSYWNGRFMGWSVSQFIEIQTERYPNGDVEFYKGRMAEVDIGDLKTGGKRAEVIAELRRKAGLTN